MYNFQTPYESMYLALYILVSQQLRTSLKELPTVRSLVRSYRSSQDITTEVKVDVCEVVEQLLGIEPILLRTINLETHVQNNNCESLEALSSTTISQT